MQSLKGGFFVLFSDKCLNCGHRGASDLNDMKDMLANLPQYQEQREKVFGKNCNNCLEDSFPLSSPFI